MRVEENKIHKKTSLSLPSTPFVRVLAVWAKFPGRSSSYTDRPKRFDQIRVRKSLKTQSALCENNRFFEMVHTAYRSWRSSSGMPQ